MKKSIIQIVIFLTILLAADRIFGYFLETKYLKNTCAFSNGELNQFLKKKRCDTLFLGSSRVLHMIQPDQFGKGTLNLSKQQKHIYHNAALIDILYQENKLPKKLLVLNFETEDCFMEMEKSLLDRVYSLKFYYHKNKLVKKLIDKRGFQERIKFLSSTYRFNDEGWKLLTYPLDDICPEYPERGYIPLMPDKNDSLRLLKSIIKDISSRTFDELNPTTFELLLHIKALCQKKGVKLVIINAPFYTYPKDFIRGTDAISSFCTKNKIDYIDFNTLKIPELQFKKFWYDNMHTNSDGSKIYTNYLKKALKETE